MNRKYLMMASAVVMAVFGIAASFLPAEIQDYVGAPANGTITVFIQVTGALFLGFAMMNWMAKSVLIGGIYAKPLAIGNCLHFTVAALALLKFVFNNHHAVLTWFITVLYMVFALLFAIVVFTNPKPPPTLSHS